MFTDIKKIQFKIIKENQEHFVTGIPEAEGQVFFKANSDVGFNLVGLAAASGELTFSDMQIRTLSDFAVDKLLIRYTKFNEDGELESSGHVVVHYPRFRPTQNTTYNFRVFDLVNGTEIDIPGLIDDAFICVDGEVNIETCNARFKITAEGNERVNLEVVGFTLDVETGIYVKDTETQSG